jgi:PAS domain S-box-containing protein
MSLLRRRVLRWRDISLGTKGAGVFALFSVVMLLVIGWVTWRGAEDRLRSVLEERLESVTLAAAARARDHFQDLGRDMAFMALSQPIRDLAAGLGSDQAAAPQAALDHATLLLTAFARPPRVIQAIRLIDVRHGRTLLDLRREAYAGTLLNRGSAAPPTPEELAMLRGLDAGRLHINGINRPAVAVPLGGEGMPSATIDLIRVVGGSADRPPLAVVLESSFNQLAFNLTDGMSNATGLVLFDQAGRLLSRQGVPVTGDETPIRLRDLFDIAAPDLPADGRMDARLTMARSQAGGIAALARVHMHPDSPETIIVGAVADPTSFLLRLAMALDRTVYLAAGFLVLGSLVFVVLGTTVLRPIRSLIRQLEDYEPGAGMRAVGADHWDRSDEFGFVARGIGQLVARLERQIMRARLAGNDMRRVFETAADPMVLVSDLGAIEDVNRAAEVLFGWTRHELAGRRASVLLAAEDSGLLAQESLEHAPSEAIASQPDPDQRVTAVVRDGIHVPVALTVNDLERAGPHRYVVKLRDLRGEDALETAQSASAAKSRFLANMSHELRTPLNAITLHAAMIADEAEGSDNEALEEDSRKIQAAAGHLLDLINGILDLARIESGRLVLSPEPTDLSKVMQEIRAMGEALARKQRNVFKVEAQALPERLFMDRLRLRQCLLNLISNSAKFTQDGTISVHARCDGESLLISVADTGIGMTDEEIERIFEMFEQASGYIRAQHGGSGVGLALTRQLLAMMGGTISVSSAPGEGSRFDIVLPVAGLIEEPTAEPETVEVPTEPVVSRQGHRAAPMALVVDRDTDRRHRQMRLLRQAGLAPVGAVDVEDAAERARVHKPDLVLVSVGGVHDDAAATQASLRDQPALAEVPIYGLVEEMAVGLPRPLLVGQCGRHRLISGSAESLSDALRTCLTCGLGAGNRQASEPPAAPVMVVEDDEGFLHALARVLERAGLPVVCFSNGDDAMAFLRASVPGQVLLDLALPGVSGFEILKSMRADARLASVPVRIITGIDLTADQVDWLKARASVLLRKGAFDMHWLVGEMVADAAAPGCPLVDEVADGVGAALEEEGETP